ncbi:MAG: hypothetical protein JW819_04925 [Candidatus Krumholzibacteriota bacterium]|nr:hypothetical protein [Candidatus Krumholzibacteriota bacterium]
MTRTRAAVLTLLLLLASLPGLLVHLDADPSRLLPRDFITDEGWWTGEARDKVLFGQWILDEYSQGLTSPLGTAAWWLSFRLMGVSLLAARLPAALAALIALVALGLLLRASREPVWPVLALLASAVPFALHARVALPDMLSVALMSLAWWLAARGHTGRAILAGVLLGAALSAKLSTLVALPALAWVARGEDGAALPLLARWRRAVHLVFAAALAWTLLRLPVGLAFPRELAVVDAFHRAENLPGSVIDLLANLAFFPWPAPFLMQAAPLVALAGLGAWQVRLDARGRGIAGQALAFLLIAGLAQSLFAYPADRRFLVFLPALAVLAARGWRALAEGEAVWRPDELRRWREARGAGALARFGAALAAAFVLPGRLALWGSRLLGAAGRPVPDAALRAAAAALFVATLIGAWLWLRRRPGRAGALLRGSLVAGWLFVCFEQFDFLVAAGLFARFGGYDAGPLWAGSGGWWSVPWCLVTLALVWLPLARGGLLPRIPGLERCRRALPPAAAILALLVLAPHWARPTFTLRDAATRLKAPAASGAPCLAVLGAEAPTLALGSEVQTVTLRGAFNAAWQEAAPPGVRRVALRLDDDVALPDAWPAGAASLAVCPVREWGAGGGRPRFVFAVWEPAAPPVGDRVGGVP